MGRWEDLGRAGGWKGYNKNMSRKIFFLNFKILAVLASIHYPTVCST